MTTLGQGSGTDDWPDAIRRHAFGIGVATYKEGWDNLPHVPGDVAAILDVLAAFDYRPAQSYPRGLIDPPTPARIRTELRDWAKAEDLEDDMLVVYHAGHGVNEDNQHFLVCNETERDLDVAPETALLTSRLVELLGNSGARRLLVILDACYAGDGAAESLALEARNQIVAAASASPERRRHWKSLEVLAAARCGEAAEDGVFAEVLTSVLRNSVINRHRLAGNRAPYIRLDQVVREVNRILEAERIPQRVDHAQMHGDGIGFLPNPHYVANLPEKLDIAEQLTLTGRADRMRLVERTGHFGSSARGVHSPSQAGHYFTGRTAILTRLANWLGARSEQNIRVFQIAGSAGTGKSSVLGRVVALSDPILRAGIPDSTVLLSTDLPAGIVDVAIHAARRTLAEVLTAFADALGVSGNDPDRIITALRARTRPFTAVIDALDESGTGADGRAWQEIIAFLRMASARAPQLHLLLGGRPHVFSNYPSGGFTTRVNLDESNWSEHSDIVAYAATLLTAPHGPGSETGLSERLKARAAAEVADIAQGNYLVARLIARALADPDRELWRTDPGQWAPLLPAPGVDGMSHAEVVGAAFRWALDTQLGPAQAARTRALLSPLAYAQGAGLPLASVWPAAASAFTGWQVTEDDLIQLLATDAAAPYVVEALDSRGRSVYRLYHQALADDLQLQTKATTDAQQEPGSSPARPGKNVLTTMFDRLYELVTRAADGSRDWHGADPYLLDHLPAHAADGDRLHILLENADYLVIVKPAALLPVLDQTKTPVGRLTAAIYRSCAEHLQGATPDARRWALATAAARLGYTQLKDRLRPAATDGLWPRWSTGPARSALRNTFSGSIAPVIAIACTTLDDQPVVVTGSYDCTVRVWDLSRGQAIWPPLKGHTKEVRTVACTQLDGQPVAISTGHDRTVRIWDLTQGKQIGQAVTANKQWVDALACAMLDGKPVAVTGGDGGLLQAWDLTRSPLRGETFSAGRGRVEAVDCTILNGRPIVVAGDEHGIIWTWDLATRELIDEPRERPYGDRIATVACTMMDGRPVAVIVHTNMYGTYEDGAVWVWDLARRREIGRPFRGNGRVRSATCAVINGRSAAVTADAKDGTIRAWDIASHQRIGKTIQGSPSGAQSIAATELNGRPVAITGSNDDLVQVWDLSDPKRTTQSISGHDDLIRAVAYTHVNDQPVVVTASEDRTMRIWDLGTGRQTAVLPTDRARIKNLTCVAAPDGHSFAVTEGYVEGTARIWNLSHREQVGELGDNLMAATTTVVRGRAVALISDKHGVSLWDLVRGEQTGTLSAGEDAILALACTITADGRSIAVGYGNKEIWTWDLDRGVTIGKPLKHYYIRKPGSLACTSAGSRSFAVSIHTEIDYEAMNDGNLEVYFGEVYIWDLSRGKGVGPRRTPTGDYIRGVACAQHHGRPVAFTGGDDRRVRMWDLTKGKLIGSWPVHGEIRSIACEAAEGILVLGVGSDVLVADIS
jgi:WD40 repeat protein